MHLPIQKLRITSLLSFGEEAEDIELRPLNVLIGPNASGKSNLIETVNLLAEMPRGLSRHIANNSGILHWLWKGAQNPVARIEVEGTVPGTVMSYSHSISFGRIEQAVQITDEQVNIQDAARRRRKPVFEYEHGAPVLRKGGRKSALDPSKINRSESILSNEQPSEALLEVDPVMRLYRSFQFFRGRMLNHIEPAKQPQQADQYSGFLLPNARNLGVVINSFRNKTRLWQQFLNSLKNIFEGVEDLYIVLEGGTSQLYLQEAGLLEPIPASRFSDGTFRWICLLAILLHPAPPPLICFEEPEIGLHPDVIVELADLLRSASERTQLIVTTHSDILVDALSDTPEAVIVCERSQGATRLRRLGESSRLRDWLKQYGGIGKLWRQGYLGGNRW